MEKLTRNELCAIEAVLGDRVEELRETMNNPNSSDLEKCVSYRLMGNYDSIRNKILNVIGDNSKRIAIER